MNTNLFRVRDSPSFPRLQSYTFIIIHNARGAIKQPVTQQHGEYWLKKNLNPYINTRRIEEGLLSDPEWLQL
ncbi:uncharacterized protein LAJ45_05495 [Morchella importuna]|uniref:uncharacterized protein n=1 Tax=Morchella importuna TaxID=1174673 RepID=UPI001E8D60A4|nr:uncharacterized protein LAJ45_05495 [Morchella importuna]KAH8150284.1 hypothetical protein LAJ45_05495 [Morchella importuna]